MISSVKQHSSVSPVSSVVDDRPQGLDGRRGFTLLELMVVISLIAIVAAIAAAGLTRVRLSALQASAIQSLRTIHSAEDAFRATCGHGHDYATNLVQLGAAQAISSDMSIAATITKARYVITVTGTAPGEATDACSQGETASHWYATAVPEQGAPTGLPGYAMTDGEDVWQDSSGAAPVPPFSPSDKVSRVERR